MVGCQIGCVFAEYDLFKTYGMISSRFVINFLRQEHQTEHQTISPLIFPLQSL